jgi:hypothetical protein
MSGRRRPVKLYVSAEEHGRLLERAQSCDLPVSVYLRRLGTGYEPKSTPDAQAILSLIKVNADQGRLGGLLKLWLSERPGEGAARFEVRHVLRRIEAAQLELRAIIRRLSESSGEPQ